VSQTGLSLAATSLAAAETLFSSGQFGDARGFYELAVEHGAGSALVFARLALIAHEERRLTEAQALAEEAVAIDAASPEHRYLLGRVLKAHNDFVAADAAYREALRLRPDYLDAWISLGIVSKLLGRLAEAEACQRAAVRLDPGCFVAQLALAQVVLSQGRAGEAIDCYRRAVELEPSSTAARQGFGEALLRLNYAAGAVEQFAKVLELDARSFDAAMGLGKALHWSGHYEQAISAFRMAAELRPNDHNARLEIANLYLRTRRLDLAQAECELLLQEQAAWPAAQTCLANVLTELGEFSRPKELYERALAAEPENHAAKANYALLLLRHRKFGSVWDHYESRWPGVLLSDAFERDLDRPRWDGQPLAGKTLLITAEQGLGDELLFASVIPDVLRDAEHCIVECDNRLAPLFSRSFPQATVVGVDRKRDQWTRQLADRLPELPSFDYWTPTGSLPRHRRRTAEDFPVACGYLHADAQRVAYWRQRFSELGPGPKIGVSWRGGSRRTRNAVRSLSLERLTPILSQPAHWVSLQYGPCRDEIDAFSGSSGVAIHHWPEVIDDYDETAALVSSLDLVISVCTAVVNLGGALGRPVWAMAPLVANFRYGSEGKSTIWYPSVRVFRQQRLDDWEAVLTDVRAALGELAV
jgi:tetratricopeptide (TPR) repeat protein